MKSNENEYADEKSEKKAGKKGKSAKGKKDKVDRLSSELGLDPAEINIFYGRTGRRK